MARFGKFWGAIGGSVLAVLFYFAAQFFGGSCTGEGAAMVCTVFGVSNIAAYGILNTIFMSLGVLVSTDSRVPKAQQTFKSG